MALLTRRHGGRPLSGTFGAISRERVLGEKNHAMSDGIQTRAVGRRTEDGLLIRLARQLGLQGTGHSVPPCLPEFGPDTRGMEADGGKGL